MQYQPKGGMCMNCVHSLRDCSWLPFASMPSISRHNGTIVVRCTQYVPKTK